MLGEKIYIFLAVQSNLSWNESKLNLTVCTSQSLCHFTSKRSSMEKKIMHVCICVYVCLWLIYWRALHWCWQKDKFALLVLLCPSRASVHSLAGKMNWDKMSEQEMSDRCQTTVVHITDRHTHTHTHRPTHTYDKIHELPMSYRNIHNQMLNVWFQICTLILKLHIPFFNLTLYFKIL